MEYNGWTNRETWAVNLWMSNDEGSQRYADEIASRGGGAYAVGLELREWHEEEMPEVSGVWADLLGGALREVNWTEIAEHLIADNDDDN